MKTVAVVAYCRTGIAKAVRGALNQTHGIPLTAHVLRGCGLPEGATGHNVGSGLSAASIVANRIAAGGMSTAAYLERA